MRFWKLFVHTVTMDSKYPQVILFLCGLGNCSCGKGYKCLRITRWGTVYIYRAHHFNSLFPVRKSIQYGGETQIQSNLYIFVVSGPPQNYPLNQPLSYGAHFFVFFRSWRRKIPYLEAPLKQRRLGIRDTEEGGDVHDMPLLVYRLVDRPFVGAHTWLVVQVNVEALYLARVGSHEDVSQWKRQPCLEREREMDTDD